MKFNKYFFLILIPSVFLFAREHVAIIDFENIDVSENEAKALTQKLTTELIKLGEFTILERSEMKKVLEEQKFQYSGCVDIKCAVKIGQMLGAKYMIVGSVSKVGNTFSVDSRLIKVETGESYDSADFSHTGAIDYVLTEGMKSIAHQLCDIDYKAIPPEPEKTTITMNTSSQTNTNQSTIGATLIITSNPAGAEIYIDDNFIGITPLELANYPIGEYNVSAQMEYYYLQEQNVKLVPMGLKNLDFELFCDRLFLDCNMKCGGDAKIDNCGICDNNLSNDCKQDCAGIWGGSTKNDCYGICGGNATIDSCGECNGKDLAIDCDGVCFGKNIKQYYCYDANGDGDGDIETQEYLCPQELDSNWVSNCKLLKGKLNLTTNFDNLYDLKIGRWYYKDLNSINSFPIGEYELTAKTKYLLKEFTLNKTIEIKEDETENIFIDDIEIKDLKKRHKTKVMISSFALFVAWITWGLMDYEV